MKTQTLFFALALALGSNAFAASKAKTISGTDAQKQLATYGFDTSTDLEGDGCSVEIKQRSHDLEIVFSENGHQKVSMEIFADTEYKMVDQSKGDDSKFTLSAGKASITVEAASDAFYNVSATVNGVSSTCEQDM